MSFFRNFHSVLENISSSNFFHHFIMSVILLAGLVVGLETSEVIKSKAGTLLEILDSIILWIFVIEIFINIGAQGSKPWRFFMDGWYIFDFLIVAVCFLPVFFPDVNTEFFAVLRLARVLRLVKIFRKNTEPSGSATLPVEIFAINELCNSASHSSILYLCSYRNRLVREI